MRNYRGMRIDNGEWVFGYFTQRFWEGEPPTSYIFVDKVAASNWQELLFSVIPETVGQDTGKKDKNGVKIYKKDIIRGRNACGEIEIAEVRYIDGGFRPLCNDEFGWTEIEVIGNVTDNPELLEVE